MTCLLPSTILLLYLFSLLLASNWIKQVNLFWREKKWNWTKIENTLCHSQIKENNKLHAEFMKNSFDLENTQTFGNSIKNI